MAAAFFIALREGLEAALIVGIIAAYLAKIGRRDVLPAVMVGVVGAIALSLMLGVAVVITVGELPELVQATIEGLAAVAAVVVVTWMLFWMRRQGRGLKTEIEGQVAIALAAGTAATLVGMAFLAVIREGLETTLFFLALLASRGDTMLQLVGGLLGLVVAAGLGWAIFRAGVRINLRRFFTITGVILIFVAAGLVVYAVHEFTEAGLLPIMSTAFDLSGLLSQTSPIGSVLYGLFGYRETPSILEVACYLLYLLPVVGLFLFDDRLPRRRQVARA